MKTLFRATALAASLLTAAAAVGQTSVSPYRPGLTGEGAVYFLPKTALRISVLVEKTTYTPGDLASYAQRYLRLTNVGLEPTVSHRVISVGQMAVGVADETKCYAVKYNPATVAANVVLSDDGCLLAVNAEADRPELPAPFRPAEMEEAPNPRLFMGEEILAAGSTAKMAELTAQEIYDIRENRSMLVKGQADFMPKDGEQLRLMLNQLEKQDKALTSMFQGVTVRDTTEHIITFIPDGPVNRHLLFRLSKELGMVDADDLSGAPFYISIDDLTSLPPTDEEAVAKAKAKKKPPSRASTMWCRAACGPPSSRVCSPSSRPSIPLPSSAMCSCSAAICSTVISLPTSGSRPSAVPWKNCSPCPKRTGRKNKNPIAETQYPTGSYSGRSKKKPASKLNVSCRLIFTLL